jgi:hypothetical protein
MKHATALVSLATSVPRYVFHQSKCWRQPGRSLANIPGARCFASPESITTEGVWIPGLRQVGHPRCAIAHRGMTNDGFCRVGWLTSPIHFHRNHFNQLPGVKGFRRHHSARCDQIIVSKAGPDPDCRDTRSGRGANA